MLILYEAGIFAPAQSVWVKHESLPRAFMVCCIAAIRISLAENLYPVCIAIGSAGRQGAENPGTGHGPGSAASYSGTGAGLGVRPLGGVERVVRVVVLSTGSPTYRWRSRRRSRYSSRSISPRAWRSSKTSSARPTAGWPPCAETREGGTSLRRVSSTTSHTTSPITSNGTIPMSPILRPPNPELPNPCMAGGRQCIYRSSRRHPSLREAQPRCRCPHAWSYSTSIGKRVAHITIDPALRLNMQHIYPPGQAAWLPCQSVRAGRHRSRFHPPPCDRTKDAKVTRTIPASDG